MQFKFFNHEKMLLELLKAALNRKSVQLSIFQNISEEDWKRCFEFSKVQGVTSLAWDGLVTLPKDLLPPRKVKLPWALVVEKQEKRYDYYAKTTDELKKLFLSKGITMLQLKGTGLSTYYPIPKHREGGDIDIYTYFTGSSVLKDNEAREQSDSVIEELGIHVEKGNHKHSEFLFHKIPVENHKFFLETESLKSAGNVDAFLLNILNPQKVNVCDGLYEIEVPSSSFNTLFLAFHAIQHYGNGLCLHHLCDWVCLLNNYGLVIPKGFSDRRVLTMINIFTEFCNRYLGTSVKVECSEMKLDSLISEMLRPPYPMDYKGMKGSRIFIYKLKRFWHYLKLRKEIMDEPILHGFFHSLGYHVRKPRLLLK